MDYKGYLKAGFLTPARNKSGKGYFRALKVRCIQCFENENGRKFCLEIINVIIHNELHKVCHASTNSILQDLHQFTWNQERKSP